MTVAGLVLLSEPKNVLILFSAFPFSAFWELSQDDAQSSMLKALNAGLGRP
jgi:hypothetical protein